LRESDICWTVRQLIFDNHQDDDELFMKV